MSVVRDAESQLVTLVYELLDAHDDTARLAAATTTEAAWSEHLDYLQRLQRVGREMLAARSESRVG